MLSSTGSGASRCLFIGSGKKFEGNLKGRFGGKFKGTPNFGDFQLMQQGRVIRFGSCSISSWIIIEAWYANRFGFNSAEH